MKFVQRSFVGPYEIGQTIGKGIFAEVKLGRDEMGRLYAIKVLSKQAIEGGGTQKGQSTAGKKGVKMDKSKNNNDVDDQPPGAKPHAQQQLDKEIAALRICQHPNIVKFIEVLETRDSIYLVMEHLPNGELFGLIDKRGRLEESEAARLFGQIASAVAYLHQRGIVHRDIKPENILLDENGNTRLVDFGLATFLGLGEDNTAIASPLHSTSFSASQGGPNPSSRRQRGDAPDSFGPISGGSQKGLQKGNNSRGGSRKGSRVGEDTGDENDSPHLIREPGDPVAQSVLKTCCGSPHYAAPEVLTGGGYRAGADIWSLGVLLFAMLVGSLPFTGQSTPELIRRVVEVKYKMPMWVCPGAQDIITRILNRDPLTRPTINQILQHPWLLRYNGQPSRGLTDEQGGQGQEGLTSPTSSDSLSSTSASSSSSSASVSSPRHQRTGSGQLMRAAQLDPSRLRGIRRPAAPLPPVDPVVRDDEFMPGMNTGSVGPANTIRSLFTPSPLITAVPLTAVGSLPDSTTMGRQGPASPNGSSRRPRKASYNSADFGRDALQKDAPADPRLFDVPESPAKSRREEEEEHKFLHAAETGDYVYIKKMIDNTLPPCLAPYIATLPTPSSPSTSRKGTQAIDIRKKGSVSTWGPVNGGGSPKQQAGHSWEKEGSGSGGRQRSSSATALLDGRKKAYYSNEKSPANINSNVNNANAISVRVYSSADDSELDSSFKSRRERSSSSTASSGAGAGHALESVVRSIRKATAPSADGKPSFWNRFGNVTKKGEAGNKGNTQGQGQVLHDPLLEPQDSDSGYDTTNSTGSRVTRAHWANASTSTSSNANRSGKPARERTRNTVQGVVSRGYVDWVVEHNMAIPPRSRDHSPSRSASNRRGVSSRSPSRGRPFEEQQRDWREQPYGEGDSLHSPANSVRYFDIRATGIDRWNALHFAARNGHANIVRLLITCGRALDIDATTKAGWTPLMIASDRGHTSIVELLISYKASIHLSNHNNKSAIYLARDNGHTRIAQLLTTASSTASSKRTKLLAHPTLGPHAAQYRLFRAAEEGDAEGVREMMRLAEEAAREVAQARAKIRQKRRKERNKLKKLKAKLVRAAARQAQRALNPTTATQSSSEDDKDEDDQELDEDDDLGDGGDGVGDEEDEKEGGGVISGLKERLRHRDAVNPAATTFDNWTALHLAARAGHVSVIKALTELRTTDINAITKRGWTPLMLASQKGHVEAVKLLLQLGASVHTTALDGSTALSLAHSTIHSLLNDAL